MNDTMMIAMFKQKRSDDLVENELNWKERYFI